MSGDLTQGKVAPQLELTLGWLQELREILKLAPLDREGEGKVVEVVAQSHGDATQFASDQALNAALLNNVKRNLPDVNDEAQALVGPNEQQQLRLQESLASVHSALEKGQGEDAQKNLRSYEILIAQIGSEIIAERDQTSLEEAYAKAMNTALQRAIATLNKEANGIDGKTSAEETLLQGQVESAQKLLANSDFEATQHKLDELERSLAEVSAAVVERARRKDVAASIERRYLAVRAHAQEVTSQDLKINNPSPELNKREADIHVLRTAAEQLVKVAQGLVDGARAPFDNAVAAALAKINEIKTASVKREQELGKMIADTRFAEIRKQAGAIGGKLPSKEFPAYNKASRDALTGYTTWKNQGRHKESLADLATVEDGLQVAREFVAIKAPTDAAYDKLRQDKATLPAHREQLELAYQAAQKDADSLLSNQLSAQDVFNTLGSLLERIEQYNQTRLELERQLAEARERWQIVAARVDGEQAKVGKAIEELSKAAPPPLDEINSVALAVGSTLERLDEVQRTLRSFDEQVRKWRLLPKQCSGALAEFGKVFSKQLETLVKGSPASGYAHVADVLDEKKRELIEPALKRLATALNQGESKAKSDRIVKEFFGESVKVLLGNLDYTQADTIETAAKDAEDLLTRVQGSGTFLKLLGTLQVSVNGVIGNLPSGCTIFKETLASAEQLAVSDPDRGTKILTDVLKPLVIAANIFANARKPLGGPFNKVAGRIGNPQAQILRKLRSDNENLAKQAKRPQDFEDAAQGIGELLAVVEAIDKFGLARESANSALVAVAGLAHSGNQQQVADEDHQARQAIDRLLDSVATATDVASYGNCARELNKLVPTLTGRLKSRRAALQQQLKTKLKQPVDVSGVIGNLVSGAGGDAALDSLSRSLGEDDLVALVSQLHTAQSSAKPDQDAAVGVSHTLGQLQKGIAPAQLKTFMHDGCGGAQGLSTLLEQGFAGNVSQLTELNKLYPEAAKLKGLIDTGFGNVEAMSKALKTGRCSAKHLSEIDAEFDHADLKKLLDDGFGTPEALGEVLRNGCKGKVKTLKELSTTFSNVELKSLLTNGCGDAQTLGSMMGTGCNGEPAKLKTLNDAFAANLPQLKEVVDGFGGQDCGTAIRDVAKRHYGDDLTKLKTNLYDEVAAAFPHTKATRDKLFKAAPSFKCQTANNNLMNVPIEADKFTNVRVEHFLDRHSRDYFDFNKIKAEQTMWPPDFPVQEIERAASTMLAQTKHRPNFAGLAVGNSDVFDLPLPEYGVTVRIAYKKYSAGDKLCVDRFQPTVSTGVAGTRLDVTPEKFYQNEMQALKKAFNR